ncbi:MAG: hypothetical protein JW810_11595, partial [Sedimentisphaerales bacterium]|nr:hypothetical protein [Sedimentisphaerales bacterium]
YRGDIPQLWQFTASGGLKPRYNICRRAKLFMKYPIQPGLAFHVYRYLKQNKKDEEATKLKERFVEIGHIFPEMLNK